MKMDRVGIVGLGLLGSDIVALALSRGLKIAAVDVNEGARAKLPQRVSDALNELVEHAGFKDEDFAGWKDRLEISASYETFADCDFVIESVFENAKIKQTVFAAIEEVISETTPIASNTSALPISEMQKTLNHPDRFLGMHFGQPAYAQPFLEIIRGQQTSDTHFETANQLGLLLGKEPSLLNRDLPGFLVNRIAYAMYREAANLVSEGIADYESIDNAIRNSIGIFASMAGPFRWMDISGGPALYGQGMKTIWPTLNQSSEPPEFIQEMIDNDDRGTASGKGFYEYEEGDAELWDKAFREHVWRLLKLRQEEERRSDFPE